jgi:hypothetical protein
MKISKWVTTVSSTLLLVLFSCPALADAVVVVHSSVEETEISASDLQRIFLKKKSTWADGSKIRPCMLKEGTEVDALMAKINRSSAQFRAFWSKKLFAGEGVPPKSFETSGEALEFAAKEKGAVCLVSSADVGETDFKVLSVDGQSTL